MRDIVCPTGDPTVFLEISKRLGYTSLILATPSGNPSLSHHDPSTTHAIICTQKDLLTTHRGVSYVLYGSDREHDRWVVEHAHPTHIFSCEMGKGREHMHQRN